jgi:hypothetical protein
MEDRPPAVSYDTTVLEIVMGRGIMADQHLSSVV